MKRLHLGLLLMSSALVASCGSPSKGIRIDQQTLEQVISRVTTGNGGTPVPRFEANDDSSITDSAPEDIVLPPSENKVSRESDFNLGDESVYVRSSKPGEHALVFKQPATDTQNEVVQTWIFQEASGNSEVGINTRTVNDELEEAFGRGAVDDLEFIGARSEVTFRDDDGEEAEFETDAFIINRRYASIMLLVEDPAGFASGDDDYTRTISTTQYGFQTPTAVFGTDGISTRIGQARYFGVGTGGYLKDGGTEAEDRYLLTGGIEITADFDDNSLSGEGSLTRILASADWWNGNPEDEELEIVFTVNDLCEEICGEFEATTYIDSVGGFDAFNISDEGRLSGLFHGPFAEEITARILFSKGTSKLEVAFILGDRAPVVTTAQVIEETTLAATRRAVVETINVSFAGTESFSADTSADLVFPSGSGAVVRSVDGTEYAYVFEQPAIVGAAAATVQTWILPTSGADSDRASAFDSLGAFDVKSGGSSLGFREESEPYILLALESENYILEGAYSGAIMRIINPSVFFSSASSYSSNSDLHTYGLITPSDATFPTGQANYVGSALGFYLRNGGSERYIVFGRTAFSVDFDDDSALTGSIALSARDANALSTATNDRVNVSLTDVTYASEQSRFSGHVRIQTAGTGVFADLATANTGSTASEADGLEGWFAGALAEELFGKFTIIGDGGDVLEAGFVTAASATPIFVGAQLTERADTSIRFAPNGSVREYTENGSISSIGANTSLASAITAIDNIIAESDLEDIGNAFFVASGSADDDFGILGVSGDHASIGFWQDRFPVFGDPAKDYIADSTGNDFAAAYTFIAGIRDIGTDTASIPLGNASYTGVAIGAYFNPAANLITKPSYAGTSGEHGYLFGSIELEVNFLDRADDGDGITGEVVLQLWDPNNSAYLMHEETFPDPDDPQNDLTENVVDQISINLGNVSFNHYLLSSDPAQNSFTGDAEILRGQASGVLEAFAPSPTLGDLFIPDPDTGLLVENPNYDPVAATGVFGGRFFGGAGQEIAGTAAVADSGVSNIPSDGSRPVGRYLTFSFLTRRDAPDLDVALRPVIDLERETNRNTDPSTDPYMLVAKYRTQGSNSFGYNHVIGDRVSYSVVNTEPRPVTIRVADPIFDPTQNNGEEYVIMVSTSLAFSIDESETHYTDYAILDYSDDSYIVASRSGSDTNHFFLHPYMTSDKHSDVVSYLTNNLISDDQTAHYNVRVADDGISLGVLGITGEYARIGLWHEDPDDFVDSTSRYSGAASSGSEVFSYRFGTRTQHYVVDGRGQLVSDVPYVGSATYSGAAVGAYFNSTSSRETAIADRAYLAGAFLLTVSFGSKDIGGMLTLRAFDTENNALHDNDSLNLAFGADVSLSDGIFFSGDIAYPTDAAGDSDFFDALRAVEANCFVEGEFYGTNVAEIAGAGFCGPDDLNYATGERPVGHLLTFSFLGSAGDLKGEQALATGNRTIATTGCERCVLVDLWSSPDGPFNITVGVGNDAIVLPSTNVVSWGGKEGDEDKPKVVAYHTIDARDTADLKYYDSNDNGSLSDDRRTGEFRESDFEEDEETVADFLVARLNTLADSTNINSIVDDADKGGIAYYSFTSPTVSPDTGNTQYPYGGYISTRQLVVTRITSIFEPGDTDFDPLANDGEAYQIVETTEHPDEVDLEEDFIDIFSVQAEYSMMGLWMNNLEAYLDSSQVYTFNRYINGGDLDRYAVFLGLATPASDIPITGEAQYTGVAVGAYYGLSDDLMVGSVEINVNYTDTNEVSGEVLLQRFNLTDGTVDSQFDIDLEQGKIEGNVFKGITRAKAVGSEYTSDGAVAPTCPAASGQRACGEFIGGFYGPDSEEVSGSGYIGTNPSKTSAENITTSHVNFGFIASKP